MVRSRWNWAIPKLLEIVRRIFENLTVCYDGAVLYTVLIELNLSLNSEIVTSFVDDTNLTADKSSEPRRMVMLDSLFIEV